MQPLAAMLPMFQFSQLVSLSTWLPPLRLLKRHSTTNVVCIASYVVVRVRSSESSESRKIDADRADLKSLWRSVDNVLGRGRVSELIAAVILMRKFLRSGQVRVAPHRRLLVAVDLASHSLLSRR